MNAGIATAMAAPSFVSPASEAEAASLIASLAAARTPVELVGGGSKRGVGRPVNAGVTLSSSALSGITAYVPTEMVISAKAGTPLADVEAELARNGQRFAFEPGDWRALLGSAGEPTLGAVAAANVSGPRRFVAGAARDSLLGVRFINGAGEIIKNGGRVMKNVTGLDLAKVLAGSWGTLSFLTEVTFKVQPVPETEATVVILGLSELDGVKAMARALATHAEVSGAAHLPELVNASVLDGAMKGPGLTALRIEGLAQSVSVRVAFLKDVFKAGDVHVLDAAASAALWAAVRDVTPFRPATARDARPVWRVSMAPDCAVLMVDALRRQAGLSAFYDWQGGLAWLRMEHGAEAGALRAMMARFGSGHATLVRADAVTRAAVPVFEPEPKAIAALSARVRAAFDPAGIFNPGRMG
jgi:glycolate oxidase FAD binding subunit